MPIRKSDGECSLKLLIWKGWGGGGGLGAQPYGSNNSFADDKAPGDLIP